MIQIEQTDKSKNQEKYKHEDEDAWAKKHPGKEFKPFDPERTPPHNSSKD